MRRKGVSTELRDRVLQRDSWICFLKRVHPWHVCTSRLTVDHVHDAGGTMGKRAPDDERHLVALCLDANVRGVSRDVRQAQRQYLTNLYDRCDECNTCAQLRGIHPDETVCRECGLTYKEN